MTGVSSTGVATFLNWLRKGRRIQNVVCVCGDLCSGVSGAVAQR